MATKKPHIAIGNSQGIRIPKVLLEQTGLGEEVELEVHDAQIVIRQPSAHGRGGTRLSAPWLSRQMTGFWTKR